MQVEVEIDADSFKEPVRHRHEPQFDRHLQVLQAAELIEQIGDFLVHSLRLANDETEGCPMLADGPIAADFLP